MDDSGTPDPRTGLQVGDLILRINRRVPEDEEGFNEMLQSLMKKNMPILLSVKRRKGVAIRPITEFRLQHIYSPDNEIVDPIELRIFHERQRHLEEEERFLQALLAGGRFEVEEKFVKQEISVELAEELAEKTRLQLQRSLAKREAAAAIAAKQAAEQAAAAAMEEARRPSLRKLDHFPQDYVGQTFTYICYIAGPPYLKNQMQSADGWELTLLNAKTDSLTTGGTFVGTEHLCVLVDDKMARQLMDELSPELKRKVAVTLTVKKEQRRDRPETTFFAGRVTKLVDSDKDTNEER